MSCIHWSRSVTAGWLLVGMLVCCPVFSQTSSEDLTVRAGAIFFDRPEFDSVVLVEFPFSLSRSEYQFFSPDSSDGALFARIFAQINLYGVDGLPMDSANTYFSAAVADEASARQSDFSLLNSLVLVIHPGIYSARLTVIDAVSKKEGEFFYDRLIVEPPKKNQLALGAKCLAHRISYVGDASTTVSGVPKNGYEVLCSPLGAFSVDDTVAYLYAELYNLEFSPDQPSDFELKFAVVDEAGKPAHQLGSRVRQKPGITAVVVESFDIGGWQPGAYLLEVTAIDRAAGQEVTHDIPLLVVAPVLVGREVASVIGEDPADQLDLDVQLALIKYLLTPEERTTLDGLLEAGKMNFLDQFWRENDSDPTTAMIENRAEIYQRYLYANNFFSMNETKTDGWWTDRGRVLMVYGFWDQLDDMQHPTGGYPYQVWNYYTHGKGAAFIFQDRGNLGDFRLVHSTVAGELFSKRWDEVLRSGDLSID